MSGYHHRLEEEARKAEENRVAAQKVAAAKAEADRVAAQKAAAAKAEADRVAAEKAAAAKAEADRVAAEKAEEEEIIKQMSEKYNSQTHNVKADNVELLKENTGVKIDVSGEYDVEYIN